MTDHRYTDEDVRRILSLAAEAEVAAGTEAERPWTLGDIERIGAEAGIAPRAVTEAALALERQAAVPEEPRLFGLPVAVSRTVPLGRHLSDDDWERLVTQLRDTFSTRGQSRVSGTRREWRVGNLRVTHEPAGSGALLELRTRKGDARGWLNLGVMLLLMATFLVVLGTMADADASGRMARVQTLGWTIGVGGLLMLLVGVLRLPAWARRRAQQFEALAAYARRITAT